MNVIEAQGLGKRYGRSWALRDCTLAVPQGRVVALVGPNGAGKTTLLHLAVDLTKQTTGEITVLGGIAPGSDEALNRIGFVAQDTPLYQYLSVADTVRLVENLSARFDAANARARLAELGIPLNRKVGKLSGGQQAQVALTLALAKQPELLVLDEPVASLDPLARREFLNAVLEAVVETQMTVVISSHIVSELERVCDHLIALVDSRTQLAGTITDIVASHRLLTGPRSDGASVARAHNVIRESHTERQTTLLVRANGHVYDTCWEQHEVDLEEIVLAYLGYKPGAGVPAAATREVVEA